MTERNLRKLERAYALLLSYDIENETHDEMSEIQELIASAIGRKRTRKVISQLEREYAGSGMEL